MFDPTPQITEVPVQRNPFRPAVDLSAPLHAAKYISIERRSPSDTVFLVDDTPFSSALPKTTHWSVAWSDLMMTMFVLFLSMFVYQTANRDFLVHEIPEVVGGATSDALDIDHESRATFPFAPIKPGLPLMAGGTIKKVEPITLQDVDVDAAFQTLAPPPPEIEQPAVSYPDETGALAGSQAEPTAQDTQSNTPPAVIEDQATTAIIVEAPAREIPVPSPDQDIIEPRPLVVEASPPSPQDQIKEMYRLSQKALASNNLDKFAAIDLVPDKTMRIILTGDLLFSTGMAELSGDAENSLRKVAAVIKNTPYMINIVGHTDNVPMHSERFASNWELSVARASTVARFLIGELGMDPGQFVVSGYSSYRPLVPNTDVDSRAKNRRVEIIISKRLPRPVAATAANLQ